MVNSCKKKGRAFHYIFLESYFRYRYNNFPKRMPFQSLTREFANLIYNFKKAPYIYTLGVRWITPYFLCI